MPKRSHRPTLLIVTVTIGVPIALLLAWPQALGGEMTPVIAQIIAFRGLIALVLGLAALVAATFAIVWRRRSLAAGLAIVLAVASICQIGVLATRGVVGSSGDGDLIVLSWNTEGGAASPQDVARLILETGADIAALPETSAEAVAEVARLVADGGASMMAGTAYGETGRSPIPTSVLVSTELGEYSADESAGSTPGLPSGVWRPVDGTGPTIVAAHPRPPIPSGMGQWRAGLDWVAARCDESAVIVAGDLNATVDHMAGLGEDGALVGGCRDAALDAGSAAVGTWPTTLPALVGTPIDHVLFGSAWEARGVKIITEFDHGSSDHRPIVAELVARAG